MTCEEFERVVTDLACEFLIEAAARKRALAHARACWLAGQTVAALVSECVNQHLAVLLRAGPSGQPTFSPAAKFFRHGRGRCVLMNLWNYPRAPRTSMNRAEGQKLRTG